MIFPILFPSTSFNISKGIPSGSLSSKADEKWLTQTCTFDFSALGIWEPGLDGTDINETCRYDNHLMVADDFGRVRIYNYPCWKVNSEHKKLFGHSSHVTRVKMSKDGSILASAGGMDGSVLLWHNEGSKIWDRSDSVAEIQRLEMEEQEVQRTDRTVTLIDDDENKKGGVKNSTNCHSISNLRSTFYRSNVSKRIKILQGQKIKQQKILKQIKLLKIKNASIVLTKTKNF